MNKLEGVRPAADYERQISALVAEHKELTARINELERRNAMQSAELRKCFGDLRYAGAPIVRLEKLCDVIDATSADTEAWLQAEIVKRLGKPMFWYREGENTAHQGAYMQGFVIPLYRLPSPLATPEERKE